MTTDSCITHREPWEVNRNKPIVTILISQENFNYQNLVPQNVPECCVIVPVRHPLPAPVPVLA